MLSNTLRLNFWQTCPKNKFVCINEIINCNGNENDNDKIDHINKAYKGQDIDIETNIENIVCLGKTMSLCNKQHLSNIWGSNF